MALVVGLLLRRERHRQPYLDVRVIEAEILGQYADDRVRLAVDTHVAPDGAVLAAEPLLPRGVGQDRLARLAFLSILVREQAAAERASLEEPQQ